MTCLEFLKDTLNKTSYKGVEYALVNKRYVNKQILHVGDKVAWSYGYHVGLGILDNYGIIKTIEMSDSVTYYFNRDLYDERMHVICKIDKLKKGKNNEASRFFEGVMG